MSKSMSELKVKLKFHGEHHMGAETVEMVLPFEIDGYSALYSTNGHVVSSKNPRYLYLWDATVVLRIDLDIKAVGYLLPPERKYISEFSESEDGYSFEVYGGNSKTTSTFMHYSGTNFKPGFGPVKNGLFPSAHKPHVKYINGNT